MSDVMVRAVLYDLEVCDGFLAFSHGQSRLIREIRIPELGVFINLEGDPINIGMDKTGERFGQGRDKVETEIPLWLVDAIQQFIKSRQKIYLNIVEYFPLVNEESEKI